PSGLTIKPVPSMRVSPAFTKIVTIAPFAALTIAGMPFRGGADGDEDCCLACRAGCTDGGSLGSKAVIEDFPPQRLTARLKAFVKRTPKPASKSNDIPLIGSSAHGGP